MDAKIDRELVDDVARNMPVGVLSDDALVAIARKVEDELTGRVADRSDGTPPADLLRVPEDDVDGFVEWLETEYTDDRWSGYHVSDDTVGVWSGKYPAFQRFVKDVRPYLHEHGLVIESTRHRLPKHIGGNLEHVHYITAIPMAKAAAECYGLLCDRHACRNLSTGTSDYCAGCSGFMGDDTEGGDE